MIRLGVYLSAEPRSGGAFQYGQTLLETLALLPRAEYEVVCAHSTSAWKPHVERAGFLGLEVSYPRINQIYDRVLRNIGVWPGLWRRVAPLVSPVVRRLLAESRDLWIFPAQDSLSYQLPAPALVTIFDLMHRYERSFPEVGGLGRAWRRDIHYRNICRWSAGIIVDSEVGRRQVEESYGVDPAIVHVMPFAAPTYLSSPPVDPPAILPSVLPHKYLFYPAQFWEHKNHERLLRAVALSVADAPDIALVLAGSPKNGYDRVRQVTRELGLEDRVTFLGYVPDSLMAVLYRRARALVMPTFFGPTNIPPLEAFACDCPVACSNIYGMPEQVGDAALLFDPTSIKEIAATILRLWRDDDLCASLVARGRIHNSMWTPRQRVERFKEILQNVARPVRAEH